MHRVHVAIPWKHMDDWQVWMDDFCQGWRCEGKDNFKAPGFLSGAASYEEHIAHIKHKVYQQGNEDCSFNSIVFVDTDTKLLLLKLTWQVVHQGGCVGAQCNMHRMYLPRGPLV